MALWLFIWLRSVKAIQLCLLYILTSIWVLGTTNEFWNIFFHCFCAKKPKKEEKAKNLMQNLAKKSFFLSLHQNAGEGFYSEGNHFSVILWKYVFRYKKHSTSVQLQTLKTCFFLPNFSKNLLLFFLFVSILEQNT